MTTMSPLFTWRTAITESGLSPTARHIALTLSLYMSEKGDSAYPSHATLATDTGLARSTVTKGLREIEEAGYLIVSRAPGARGGRTRVNHYRAADPRRTVTPVTVPPLPEPVTSTDASATVPPVTVSETVTAPSGNGSPESKERYDRTTRERELPRQESATTLASAKRSRKPDPIWDALVELFGPAPVLPRFRGKWNAAAAELRAQALTAGELHEIVTAARRSRDSRWMVANPAAVASNLGQLRLGRGATTEGPDRASEIFADAERLERAGL